MIVLIFTILYLIYEHLKWWPRALSWTCRWLHRGRARRRQTPSLSRWWTISLASKWGPRIRPLLVPSQQRSFQDWTWIGVEMVNMETVTWKPPLVPYNAEKINCYCPYYSWVSNSPGNHIKTNHVQYISFFHFVSRVKSKTRERNYDPVCKTEHLVLIWVILDSAEWVMWIVLCVAQNLVGISTCPTWDRLHWLSSV